MSPAHPAAALIIEGAVIGFLIALPVGPAAILCIRRTVGTGAVAGAMTGIGAALGDAVFGAVAAFGLTFVAEFIHRNELWIRAAGGLFLFLMGISTLRHRPRSIGDPVAMDREHRALSYLRYGASTLLITVFNPITVMAFGVVFAAQGLSDVGNNTLSATILVAAVFCGALGWWAILCAIALLFRRHFDERGLQWLNRISGSALVIFGVAAAVSLLPLDWPHLLARVGITGL
jgi:threonine/homoserine/homoserine lactone efflux protein